MQFKRKEERELKIERPFKPKPDFEHLKKALMRETKQGPVPLIELVVDTEIMAEAIGADFPADRFLELYTLSEKPTPERLILGARFLEINLNFSAQVGYDYTMVFPVSPLVRTKRQLGKNPKQADKMRAWQDEHQGIITTREEFENYPWPGLDKVNIISVEALKNKLPEGMKFIFFIFGIFEDLKEMMGFETMAVKSIEEPELLGDILEKLTQLNERQIELAASHPQVGAIFYAEDMGFNNGPMLSPNWFREWVFPKHKRLADICHKHNKPFLIHSCGRIELLMEDLIEYVGIDARHSFQDNVETVEEVYKKYHSRIAILGGLDVGLLANGAREQVRARTREILEFCGKDGGFAFGSGNSVPNYCKIENYYAMIDEARKWNEDQGWL